MHKQLTDAQVGILSRTSARSLVQVVYKGTIDAKAGTADTKLIVSECWRRIEPLNGFIKSDGLYSKNQIAGGMTNLGCSATGQGFIQSVEHGVLSYVDRAADEQTMIAYIESCAGFGANSIEEMNEILDLFTDPLSGAPKPPPEDPYKELKAAAAKSTIVKPEPQPEAAPLLRAVICRVSNFIDRASQFLTGV